MMVLLPLPELLQAILLTVEQISQTCIRCLQMKQATECLVFDINHRLILPNLRTQKPSANHLLRRHASIRQFSRQFQYKIARKGIERNHTVIINHLLTGKTIRLLACQCRKASLLRMYPTSQTQQQ